MKSLKEIFGNSPMVFKEKSRTVKGKLKKNNTDLFGEYWDNPIELQVRCRNAFNNNGLISSAVDNFTDFTMGRELVVYSQDNKTEQFFQKIIDTIKPDLFSEVHEAVEQAIKTGNGYLEIEYSNDGLPIALYAISDSSRIYLNTDPFGNPLTTTKTDINGNLITVPNLDEYYIQEVPQGFRSAPGYPQPRFYTLSYTFSGYKELKIFGIPIHKDKLIHFRWGKGDDGLYGRSFIASVLDDHEILKRIEKASGIIAKYKAVPKKLIMPKEGEKFSQDDIVDLATYFEGLEDDENAVLDREVKLEDLSYSGKDVSMDGFTDHVRRKIISGLAPEFLIGYGMDVNRATAEQILIAFMLRLETKRRLWSKLLTDAIIKPYQKKLQYLQKCEIRFGDIDFRTPQERNNEIREKWLNNQITYNEMRKAIGESTLPEGNIFYKDFSQLGQKEEQPQIVQNPQTQQFTPNEQIARRALELLKNMESDE